MSDFIREPIESTDFWKDRLRVALLRGNLFQSVYMCGEVKWNAIQNRHKEIIAKHISSRDNVIDCACGYGRIIDLFPKEFLIKNYWGVDFSPDFIHIAKLMYPEHAFYEEDLTELSNWCEPKQFDWAIISSTRGMIIRHQGQAAWDKMESEIRKVVKKLLFLEYNEHENGSVE